MIRIETVEIVYATCERCLHQWKAHGKPPAVCPKCKSRLWNKSGREELTSKGEPDVVILRPVEMPEFHVGPRITRGRVEE